MEEDFREEGDNLFDITARLGTQVEAAPVADRVVSNIRLRHWFHLTRFIFYTTIFGNGCRLGSCTELLMRRGWC